MLGATVGNKRHPDMENVPPETSVANGSSSTGKGRRFFKAHGRKKTCSQQSEEDSPSHCQDEQKEPATGRKVSHSVVLRFKGTPLGRKSIHVEGNQKDEQESSTLQLGVSSFLESALLRLDGRQCHKLSWSLGGLD